MVYNLFFIAHICTKFGMCIALKNRHAGAQSIKQKFNSKNGGRYFGFLHKQQYVRHVLT